MPPKRTSTSEAPAMTQAAIRKLVADSVTTALEAQTTTANTISPPDQEKLLTESVFSRSNYTKDCKVKFATGTLTEEALSWWNSFAQPIGIEEAYKITWVEFKKLLIKKYCPRTEVQKMEDEFYHLTVKGNDLKTYVRRFQELATLCPTMVPDSEKMMEVFIGGLPQSIKGNVTASKPQTLEEAINIAQRLMDQDDARLSHHLEGECVHPKFILHFPEGRIHIMTHNNYLIGLYKDMPETGMLPCETDVDISSSIKIGVLILNRSKRYRSGEGAEEVQSIILIKAEVHKLLSRVLRNIIVIFARTFRVILFSIHNDEWKSFQCHHQTALRMSMLVKDIRSQDGKDDKDNDKGSKSRSQSMKEQAYNEDKDQEHSSLNDKSNLTDLMKECIFDEKKLGSSYKVSLDDSWRTI
ncbi:reverse transcriptase domain-containing protein [Tanacetum coccineum]